MPQPTKLTWNEFRKAKKGEHYDRMLLSHAYAQYKHYKQQQMGLYKHFADIMARVDALELVMQHKPYIRYVKPHEGQEDIVWNLCETCLVCVQGQWKLLYDEDVRSNLLINDLLTLSSDECLQKATPAVPAE